MDRAEIDLRELKRVVEDLLNHVIEDLGVEKVPIQDMEDFFWECPPTEMYDTSKKPTEWWCGRLSDDLEFVQKMSDRNEGYVAFMLTHVAPILRYGGQKVKECGSGTQLRRSDPK